MSGAAQRPAWLAATSNEKIPPPLLAGVGINPLDISSKKRSERRWDDLWMEEGNGGRGKWMKEHCIITRFRVINARGGGSFEGERTAFRICRG